MILELQGTSLARSLKDILGCYGQSCPSGLCSNILGTDLETTLSIRSALFIGAAFLHSP